MALEHDCGFAILPDVFSAAEIATVAAVGSSTILPRSRAGARNALSHPAFALLADDARLRRIASRVLEGQAFPFRATLFDKSKSANWLVVWHQDTTLPLRTRRDVPGWGPWSTKAGVLYAHAPAEALSQIVALRVHLDDSTPENGPLRVLPGTHVHGVLTDAQIQEQVRMVTTAECVAPRGAVVMMRPLLVHSSSKVSATTTRRVLHVEYATSTHLDGGLELEIGRNAAGDQERQ